MGLRAKRVDMVLSLLFLLPALVLFGILLLNPILQAVYQSFFSWKGIAGVPLKWAGLDNYRTILTDGLFWSSMGNSLIFMAGGFIVLMPLSFILALIITSSIKGTRFYKTAFFMPVMLPITAVGLMWVYILEPNWGLLNMALKWMGKPSWALNWLGIPTLNVVVVVLVNEWIYAGLNMLIFAAGLIAIDGSLYEAAEIDGASKWQRLIKITLPLTKGSFKVFSVMCVTGCLKTFDLIYAMTKGGPNHSSETPASFLYAQAFSYRNFGVGNAVGTVILVLGLILSLAINKMITQEDY
ncbi:MAG: sugar ABC transporter permease [Spirochaetaceae bacterium]|jgi:raffinose/stachyose/melibiose transport system permease protein|nr:sugar ABC transporter permease [Spirochaetaceae bacterium]